MKKNYLAYFSAFCLLSSSAYAQYCSSVGPSSTGDSNLQSFTLNGESATAITFTGCPGVIGLDDQTLNESVLLSAGSSYTAYALFGTCGGYYYGVGEAWIDYNQNQVFEITESIGTWSGTPPTATSVWNFTVPSGAISGTTRMRVVQFESGVLPIDPCAVFTWGSTTDFTVNIGGGADCTGYVGESTSDPRIVSSLPFGEDHSNTPCYFNTFTVYSSPDVYYRILPQQLGLDYLTVSLCGSAIDTYLTLVDENINVIEYNDDADGCGTSSKIHLNVASHDTLYVIVQGYSNQSGDYTISIEEELAGLTSAESFQFQLYPNPSNGLITFEIPVPSAQLEIHDVAGKLVFASEISSFETFNLGHLDNQIYFVTVISENNSSTQKLVIE